MPEMDAVTDDTEIQSPYRYVLFKLYACSVRIPLRLHRRNDAARSCGSLHTSSRLPSAAAALLPETLCNTPFFAFLLLLHESKYPITVVATAVVLAR
jgi:hypothetical protein